MTNKYIKRIWLLCLWLASLSLVGCFHVPDEDWLPNKWKVQEETIQQDELSDAFNSLIEWVNVVSSQRNEMKNNEDNNEVDIEEVSETSDEIEYETIDDETQNWEIDDINDSI